VVILLIRGIKASILWGILLVTFVSWIPTPGNKATYFTDSSHITGGEAR
jgi:xanthine/uracil/vitamin C permease (AzgA family)